MRIQRKKISSGVKLYFLKEPDPVIISGLLDAFVSAGPSEGSLSLKLIKNDFEGREVYAFEFNQQLYYLKRYFHRRPSKVIKNWVREPEGLRYFRTTVAVASLGIPVTEPVFAMTMKVNPFVTDSLYVSKEFKGVSLDKLAGHCSLMQQDRERLLTGMARMWSTLYKNRYFHGDPNLGNILVNTGNMEIALVDIDGIRRWMYLPEKKVLDNLAKLNYFSYLSFDNARGRKPDESDRAVFLDEFFASYAKRIHTPEPVNYLYLSTIKRLIRFGREDIVSKSPFLSFMQHDNTKNRLFS